MVPGSCISDYSIIPSCISIQKIIIMLINLGCFGEFY